MDNRQKTILVTGGAGYIGSVLTGLLLERNYKVISIDNLSFGGNSLLSYINHPRFSLIPGDITNQDDLSKAFTNINSVIHLAAIVGDPQCAKNPDLAIKVNKKGSELLCNISVDKGVEKFIFASTCSNYGKMTDPDGFVNEETSLNPVSLYAELKVAFEHYLFNQISSDFNPVCLRFATAYGLSPRPRFDLTVNEFTRDLVLKRNLDIYGEKFWRPYCHTVDLSKAIINVIEAPLAKIKGQTFNVGDNNENYQKQSLVEMILKQLPDRTNLVNYIHRDEDPRDYRVNFDKINNILDFKITKTVNEGIKEFIDAIQTGLIRNPDDNIYRNI